MKIFIAGNMPGRVPEEKQIFAHPFFRRRLFSYFFLEKELQMQRTFEIWTKEKKNESKR
jgi:hypothetical protein